MTHPILKAVTTATLLIAVLAIMAEPADTCTEGQALAVTIISKGVAIACLAAAALLGHRALKYDINDPDEED